MRTTYIRTSDTFGHKDAEKRMIYFNFCRKKALEHGLVCRSHIDGTNSTLFIEGRKLNIIQYYLATVCRTEDGIINGVKRIVSIIFT